MKIKALCLSLLLAFTSSNALAETVLMPISLTVPAADIDGSYTVTWGASATPGVTYVLEESTAANFITPTVAYTGANLSKIVSGKAINKTYYYRVKAKKTGLTDSLWKLGNVGCAVPGTTAAAVPATITVPVSDADGGYTVSWGASATTGVTYVLQEAVNPTFTANLRVAYAGTNLSAVIAGRAQNTTCYYRICAVKPGVKDSPWKTGNAGCAIPGTTAAAVPTTITVPVGDADGVYTVSWGASATAGVTYILEEALNPTFTVNLRAVYAGPNRSAAISGRVQNKTYYYRVRAVKAGLKDSPWSTGAAGCAVPGTTAAAVPASLAAPVSDADGVYTVNWGASATAGVTYVLEEAVNATFTVNLRVAYIGPSLSAAISGRTQSKTYYYRVRSIKAGIKDSPWKTGTAGCAVPGATAAAIPASITVPVSDGDGTYAVNWGVSATTGITYVLEEATNSTFTVNLRVAYAGPNRSAAISGRVQNKSYYYRVKAIKAGLKDSAWKTAANGCAVNFESVRLALARVIDADPKTATTTALTPAEYENLANRLGAVPGVKAADYAGDTLGTIYVEVTGGGVLFWRHITNDFLTEAATLPAEASFVDMVNPTWNSGWQFDANVQTNQSNTYATHFPVASANPDPDYLADNAVVCPNEGKIALVDFLWSEAHTNFPGLYEDQYNVDGVMFYDRVRLMGEAAGFTVDLFKDSEINLGNLNLLKDYKIVMFFGHGGRPGPKTTQRLGEALSTVLTPELYSPEKIAVGGIPYEEAWKRGYINYNIKTKTISWTAWAFRDLYQPAPNQLVMLNQCWTMLPFNVGFYQDGPAQPWNWVSDMTRPVYNIGDGLMDAGAKAVFGYINPATPEAVVHNTLPFLRRLFGGYYNGDLPPYPHTYWPTCMSAQTFFRLPWAPAVAQYAPKFSDTSLYTMYAVSESQYLREVCDTDPWTANAHAYMQSFMLQVGTPATALPICWDTYWSFGNYPSGIVDPLCSQGDNPTTEKATNDAACAVKVARKATNALLAQ
jgi:hypothetical protein